MQLGWYVFSTKPGRIGAPQGSTGLRTKNRANRAFNAKGAASKPERKLRRFIVVKNYSTIRKASHRSARGVNSQHSRVGAAADGHSQAYSGENRLIADLSMLREKNLHEDV